MNKASLYVFVLVAALLAVACGEKKKDEAAANNDEWPEMDEFHEIMAESFHPFKDSSNIEPAKANATTMAKSAEKWAGAPIPEKVNNDEVKSKLEQLKANSNEFVQIAQSGDTSKIGTSLTALHDQFHELQEIWYGGKKKEDHDKH